VQSVFGNPPIGGWRGEAGSLGRVAIIAPEAPGAVDPEAVAKFRAVHA